MVTIWERPVRPVRIVKSERAPEFDGIDVKPIEDIVIHDGELLLNAYTGLACDRDPVVPSFS